MVRLLLVPAVLLVLSGCPSSPEDECPSGGTGSLSIAVSGVPEGSEASIAVVNGDATQTVTGTTTLEELAAGEWTLRTTPIAPSAPFVRTVFDAEPPEQTVCVRDGETIDATVAFAAVPSSGKLWVNNANSATPFGAFAAEAIAENGAPDQVVETKPTPYLINAGSLAFDRRGNLWVAEPAGSIRRFPRAVLGASGETAADVTITGDLLSKGVPGPRAIAFDPDGNLWALIAWNKKLVRYGAAQLAQDGSPDPEVQITGFGDPAALAFDADGNLWVSDANDATLSRLPPSAQEASGVAAPDVTITQRESGPGSNVVGAASALAFDGEGNLWASSFSGNHVTKLPASELTALGARDVTPPVLLTFDVQALPGDIAFDEAGRLWTPYVSGKLAAFTPAQLAGPSGQVTPEVILEVPEHVDTLAVFPAPAGLPLYHALP